MANCIRCGRWLMDTWTYKCDPEEGVMTKEGPVCGCCIDDYIKEKKRIKDLGGLDLLPDKEHDKVPPELDMRIKGRLGRP